MTYEEVLAKITAVPSISVIDVKDIPHGKSIHVNNGGIINCYNSGKYVIQGKGQEQIRDIIEGVVFAPSKKVFVVYGHDDTARLQLEAMLRRWDLEPIILDQQASAGQTIIEKLEEYGSDVGYAIVLATPDDEGKAKTEAELKPRVRQNVVLEMGMFLAKLGREKVAILLKETPNFEKPSDIQGLVYIPYQNRVDDVAISLIRELARQGYNIDPNRL